MISSMMQYDTFQIKKLKLIKTQTKALFDQLFETKYFLTLELSNGTRLLKHKMLIDLLNNLLFWLTISQNLISKLIILMLYNRIRSLMYLLNLKYLTLTN